MRGCNVDDLVRRAASESGQATLEYALCVAALLALVVGIAAIWRAAEDGVLARLVEEAASHGFDIAGAIDAALF